MKIDLKDVRDGDVLQPFGWTWDGHRNFQSPVVYAGAYGIVTAYTAGALIAAAPDICYIERPEPPKPTQVECESVAARGGFSSRVYVDIGHQSEVAGLVGEPVTVIVRKQGEPLELPFTLGEFSRDMTDRLMTLWGQWLPSFLARHGCKCKEGE